MNFPPVSISRRAFTLIELLVVISIIAILAGILLPVAGGVTDNAHKVQAKNTELQIIAAIKSYQTDYGVYPVPPGTTADYVFGSASTSSGSMSGADLMSVLQSGTKDPAPTLNPRHTVYFEMPAAKNQTAGQGKNGIDHDGFPMDPWGTTYNVAVDSDYDNGLKNPYGANHNAGFDPIGTGIIVVSYGKDLKSTANVQNGGGGDKNTGTAKDDVISWQ